MRLRHLIAVLSGLAALAANLLALTGHERALAQTPPNRAGLVIQYADGSTDARCVEFEEAEITGYDLMRRSGLSVVIAPGSFGATVCKIDQQGCNYPAQSCFCECEDLNATCVYWISFVQVEGAWKYSSLGASNAKVKNGDVQGWVWSAGQAEGATTAPPAMTFDQVCAAAPASPPEPTATAAPQPTTTAAVEPTSASAATAEVQPTDIVSEAVPTAGATPSATPEMTEATPGVAEALTATATAEPSPTSPAAQAAQPSATPQPAGTTPPVATPSVVSSDTPQGTTPTGLLVFGGLVALLGAILLFTRRGARRSGGAGG